MKKLFLFASAALFSVSLFAQNPVKKAEDAVKFKELSFNFGKIKQNVPVTHDFAFTNISNSPVLIATATASCGCTTPHSPQGAIAPGKTDTISAQYSASGLGTFNKTVTVFLAGIEAPVVLTITGEVLNPDAYAKYQETKTNTPGR
jgi:hypothetical protein